MNILEQVSAKEYEGNEGIRASVITRKTERTGIVYPAEQKAKGGILQM